MRNWGITAMSSRNKYDNYAKGTGIKIEPVFDYMLNSKPSYFYEGGIILPTDDNAGTGNIVIKGRPGTGKSTLAMQIAVATTENRCDGNMFYSVYFTFEEKISHLMSKAELFGWGEQIKELVHMQDLEMNPQPDKLAESLKKILTQNEGCLYRLKKFNSGDEGKYHECTFSSCGKIDECKRIENKVLLPILSPRSIHKKTDSEQENLFWKRYNQIESFLKAAREIKDRNREIDRNISNERKYPELAVVCIDSLNVFGDKDLSREELYRLFDLFKRYQVIGVMIYEEELSDENSHRELSQMRNTIEYMADVVISLKVGQDKGYSNRYIEIEKSRYQKQIRGMHPYSIKALDRAGDIKSDFKTNSVYYLELFNSFKRLKKKIIQCCKSEKNADKNKSESLKSEIDSEIIDSIKALKPSESAESLLDFINAYNNSLKESGADNNGFREYKIDAHEEDMLKIRLKDMSITEETAPFAKELDIKIEEYLNENQDGKNDICAGTNLSDCPDGQKNFLEAVKILTGFYKLLQFNCTENIKNCTDGIRLCPLSLIWLLDDIFDSISGKYYNLKDDQLVFKSPFVIFPSLQSSYYETLRTLSSESEDNSGNDKEETAKKEKEEYAKGLGINSLKYLLPDSLTDKQTIFILGERNTFKTTIARNIIFYSLLDYSEASDNGKNAVPEGKKGENIVLIKFHDYKIIEEGKEIRVSKDVNSILKKACTDKDKIRGSFKKIAESEINEKKGTYPLLNILQSSKFLKLQNDKVNINFYHIGINDNQAEDVQPRDGQPKACLMEIELSDKSISSEELMVLISSILTAPELIDNGSMRVDRFILHDINHIGISFPLLTSNKTSNDLFLSSVTKLMRRHDVKLLMTATNGTELKISHDLISNAFAVSDIVFTFKHIEVFGSIYATIFSGNVITGDRSNNEIVPGVIVNEDGVFDVDFNILRGLVGFETGKIYRPDLNIILSKGNIYFQKYIKEMEQMLRFSLAESMKRKTNPQNKASFINVIEVDNEGSEALYEAISFNEGGPVNKTVLYSVDEFYLADKKEEDIAKVMVKLEDYKKFGSSNHDRKITGKSIDNILKKENHIIFNNKHTVQGIIDRYLVPLYTNALYLLINKKYLADKAQDIGSLTSWSSIYDTVKDKDENSDTISFCHISKETISCVFIDLILSTFMADKGKDVNAGRDDKILSLKALIEGLDSYMRDGNDLEPDWIYEDFEAFHKVFSGFFRKTFNRDEGVNNNLCRESGSPLKLVWHSHLKEIFSYEGKASDSVNNYSVIALPGGGFVGDWYVGILKGSTNIHQGIRVIETICNDVEDYKRYAVGVGLPVGKNFYKSEYPIISAQITELSLENILDIVYKNANKRSKIENYGAVREVMYEICCKFLINNFSADREHFGRFIVKPLKSMLEVFNY